MSWLNKRRLLFLVGMTALLLVVLALTSSHWPDLTGAARFTAEDGVPRETDEAIGMVTHLLPEPTYAAMIAELRSADIPPLPFADNPDPSQCGIPTQWGADNQAWLTGIYQGEMVQPVVLLYESHLRFEITARAAHGSKVEVILYQQNPVTDYYLVRIEGAEPPNEGWVPGPFLSFDPVAPQPGL